MSNVIGTASTTIPQSNIMAMWITFVITAVLPVILWIVMAKKWKGTGTAVMAGALGFFVPQMLVRIPLLSVPSVNQALVGIYSFSPIVYFLLLASTAALFETGGRLFVFKSLLKNRLSYQSAVAAGYGHGAVEAFILVGMSYASNLFLSYSVNGGTLDMSQAAVALVVAQLAQTPPTLFLTAAFERVCTVVFHVALSTLLCWKITKGKTMEGILYCIAAHGALDFFVPLIQAETGSYILPEAMMLLVAMGGIWLIRSLKSQFEVVQIPADPAKEAADQGY